MALILSADKKTIYTDKVTLDIEDTSTGWGDSKDGGGYYPDREDVGLHLFGWQMNYKSERESVLAISNTDAETAALWQLTFTNDCWFQIDMVAVTLWVAGSYDANRVVSYLGKIYKAGSTTTATPGTSAAWAEITDHETLLDTENVTVLPAYETDVYFGRYDDIFSTTFEADTMDLIDQIDTFDKNLEQRDDIFQMMQRLVFITGMDWNASKGDYFKADLVARKGNDL